LHLSLVLAHQHLGQLSRSTFEAIDANARNKVFFALAPADAKALAHHVVPYFEPADLSARDAFGIVTKLVIDGRDAQPFTLQNRPAPPAIPGRAKALRAAARARGLSNADRDTLAQARRVGPAARTTGLANPTGPTDPGGDAAEEPTNPTDPTRNPTDPTDSTDQTGGSAGAGVQPPPGAGFRPPTQHKRAEESSPN
jgi:hypothetical protein